MVATSFSAKEQDLFQVKVTLFHTVLLCYMVRFA